MTGPGGYEGVLLVSFGGPEGREDVMEFLRNTVRGRDIPDERLAAVAEHYYHFDGVSPLNGICRDLLAALRVELDAAGIDLPLYWGNRNWKPYLTDALASMRSDGIRRALAFVTSPYASYSSCRQYLDDIASARARVGERAPVVDKLRHYHDHPGFIDPLADGVRAALSRLAASPAVDPAADPAADRAVDPAADRAVDPAVDPATTRLVFTAHSIPIAMAQASGPQGGRYPAQLADAASLVANAAAPGLAWDLVYQSRSGSPRTPWLGPDINEHLAALAGAGVAAVVVSPVGFVADHLEVLWDLDVEAAGTAARLGLRYERAATPGTDVRFVRMIRDLVAERLAPSGVTRPYPGEAPGTCGPGCCQPAPVRAGA